MSESITQKTSIQLGELMVESGLLTRAHLEESLRLARQTSMPVGRVLIMSGHTDESVLQAAVQAQSLLKDGLIDFPSAVNALSVVSRDSVSLEQALQKDGWQNVDSVRPNKLGSMLLESGIITDETLQIAISGSFATGLPLGRFLVLLGAISEPVLAVALNAQVLIRDGKVPRNRAIEGLKAARLRLEVPLLEKSLYTIPVRKTLRLGELFVLSGVLSETDLMNALEVGLVVQKPIGQVMLSLGYITEESLQAALKLQQAVSEGRLRTLQASNALARVHNDRMSLADAIAQLGAQKEEQTPPALSLAKFLKLVGAISDRDIQKALQAGLENSQIVGRMLLFAGIIDEPTLQAALRCDALVRAEILTVEQACFTFNYCQNHLVNVDEALQELGWTQKIAAHWRGSQRRYSRSFRALLVIQAAVRISSRLLHASSVLLELFEHVLRPEDALWLNLSNSLRNPFPIVLYRIRFPMTEEVPYWVVFCARLRILSRIP